MEEIRRSPPNMYETLQRMGYLRYEPRISEPATVSSFALWISTAQLFRLRVSRKFTDANGIQQAVANLGCLGQPLWLE